MYLHLNFTKFQDFKHNSNNFCETNENDTMTLRFEMLFVDKMINDDNCNASVNFTKKEQ